MEEMFSKFGKIIRCEIKKGTSFDFGFVVYDDKSGAEAAIKQHEQEEVFILIVCVEWEPDCG